MINLYRLVSWATLWTPLCTITETTTPLRPNVEPGPVVGARLGPWPREPPGHRSGFERLKSQHVCRKLVFWAAMVAPWNHVLSRPSKSQKPIGLRPPSTHIRLCGLLCGFSITSLVVLRVFNKTSSIPCFKGSNGRRPFVLRDDLTRPT